MAQPSAPTGARPDSERKAGRDAGFLTRLTAWLCHVLPLFYLGNFSGLGGSAKPAPAKAGAVPARPTLAKPHPPNALCPQGEP